jgi:hypothetical protein
MLWFPVSATGTYLAPGKAVGLGEIKGSYHRKMDTDFGNGCELFESFNVRACCAQKHLIRELFAYTLYLLKWLQCVVLFAQTQRQ